MISQVNRVEVSVSFRVIKNVIQEFCADSESSVSGEASQCHNIKTSLALLGFIDAATDSSNYNIIVVR